MNPSLKVFGNINKILDTNLNPCWLCITVLHKWGHANVRATEGRRTILSPFCVKTTVYSGLIRKKMLQYVQEFSFFMYVYYYSAQYIVLTQVMSENSVIKGSMCELRSVTECKWWWPAMSQASDKFFNIFQKFKEKPKSSNSFFRLLRAASYLVYY